VLTRSRHPAAEGIRTGDTGFGRRRGLTRCLGLWLLAVPLLIAPPGVEAEVLWSDLDPRVIHQTPDGADILGGAVRRNDTASDALFFKFRIDPLSDVASEEYYALFQLFEGDAFRLGLGNAPEAWGYSAAFAAETGPDNKLPGEYNLNSSQPEAGPLGEVKRYELPRHNDQRTLVFKVQYVPGGDDLITVWLSPDLSRGATDENQPESRTTKFKANASFDQIRLRHAGGGNGWIFSDMAIATSFNDFLVVRFWETYWFLGLTALALLAGVITSVRVVEQRKYQRRLQLAEQERVVERERARIAQDLHDDLGSSLARISLLSNLVKLDKDRPHEVEAHADKLAQSADQTVRALEEIVWAVRSGSDSLQGLMDYIAHFADEMSEGKAVRCRLDLPADLPSRPLLPEVRHNIFLVVKEAITNAIKHAATGEVLIRAEVRGDALGIEVRDTGRGFDTGSLPRDSERNGLRNMGARARAINARLEVHSAPGRGTTIKLAYPFPKSVERHA
jgi:signal transduction histidine kinase